MATGGRVLHHLAAALPDPKHTVLFAGTYVHEPDGVTKLIGPSGVASAAAKAPFPAARRAGKSLA